MTPLPPYVRDYLSRTQNEEAEETTSEREAWKLAVQSE